jgi:hypothetical protein
LSLMASLKYSLWMTSEQRRYLLSFVGMAFSVLSSSLSDSYSDNTSMSRESVLVSDDPQNNSEQYNPCYCPEASKNQLQFS